MQLGASNAPCAHLEREGAEGQAGDGVARGDNVEVAGALDALAQEHGHRVAVLHDLRVSRAAQAQELHERHSTLHGVAANLHDGSGMLGQKISKEAALTSSQTLVSDIWV